MMTSWKLCTFSFFVLLGASILTAYFYYHQSTSAQDIKGTITNSTVIPQGPKPVNGTYTSTKGGFQISLPEGWSGYEGQYYTVISATGINFSSFLPIVGNPLDNNVTMEMSGQAPVSMFQQLMKSTNSTTFQDSVRKGVQGTPCKILSTPYISINGVNGIKTIKECTLDKSHNFTFLSYAFASEKGIIGIFITGPKDAIVHNLPKIDRSIQTLQIDKPTDIKKYLSASGK